MAAETKSIGGEHGPARPFLPAYIGILAALTACSARAEPGLPEKVQTALQTWLAERAPIEKVTGIADYVSLGAPGPAIEAFACKSAPKH
jgi:D-alanyl-D-alanine carboxypeptidase